MDVHFFIDASRGNVRMILDPALGTDGNDARNWIAYALGNAAFEEGGMAVVSEALTVARLTEIVADDSRWQPLSGAELLIDMMAKELDGIVVQSADAGADMFPTDNHIHYRLAPNLSSADVVEETLIHGDFRNAIIASVLSDPMNLRDPNVKKKPRNE